MATAKKIQDFKPAWAEEGVNPFSKEYLDSIGFKIDEFVTYSNVTKKSKEFKFLDGVLKYEKIEQNNGGYTLFNCELIVDKGGFKKGSKFISGVINSGTFLWSSFDIRLWENMETRVYGYGADLVLFFKARFECKGHWPGHKD